MRRTRIEWCDYSLNPVKGLCPMACKDNQGKSYCYARRLYQRFKWNPEIRYDQSVFFNLPQKPSRVFVGSTIELFGEWVKPDWMQTILTICRQHGEHTFIFLTKQPENLIKWSPFPDNCWVGVSATTNQQYREALVSLAHIQSKVKFLSFEPLLENIKVLTFDSFINWVIIGQQTPVKKATTPKIEWIEEISKACVNAGIPLFLKNNLRPLLEPHHIGG